MQKTLIATLRAELRRALSARLRMLPAPAEPVQWLDGAVDDASAGVLCSIGAVDENTAGNVAADVEPLKKPYSAATLAHARRCLADGGAWLFATLGPGTLGVVQPLCRTNAGTPDFVAWPTLIDLGDALTAAGFARSVLDRDSLAFTYRDPAAALRALRRGGWLAFADAERERQAAELLHNDDGTATVSFEIIYGLAWKMPSAEKTLQAQISNVRLERFMRPG